MRRFGTPCQAPRRRYSSAGRGVIAEELVGIDLAGLPDFKRAGPVGRLGGGAADVDRAARRGLRVSPRARRSQRRDRRTRPSGSNVFQRRRLRGCRPLLRLLARNVGRLSDIWPARFLRGSWIPGAHRYWWGWRTAATCRRTSREPAAVDRDRRLAYGPAAARARRRRRARWSIGVGVPAAIRHRRPRTSRRRPRPARARPAFS